MTLPPTEGDLCTGDIGINKHNLGASSCVAFYAGQQEHCKCVETKYKTKPLKEL